MNLGFFDSLGYNKVFVIYFVFLLLFYFLILFIFLNKNLFYNLFFLILVFIINLLVFVYLGCFFQGFVILLLYVGAITVLFLFLMMLFDFRTQYFVKIPFFYFLIIFIILFFFGLFLFKSGWGSFRFVSFYDLEDYFYIEKGLLELISTDDLILYYTFKTTPPVVIFEFLDVFLNDGSFITIIKAKSDMVYSINMYNVHVVLIFLYEQGIHLTFFYDYDRFCSQLYLINEFAYNVCFYLSIILLVGFFSLLVLLIIFSLLKKK